MLMLDLPRASGDPAPVLRHRPAPLVLPGRRAELRLAVGSQPGRAAARARPGGGPGGPDEAAVRRDSRRANVLRGLPIAPRDMGEGQGRGRLGQGWVDGTVPGPAIYSVGLPGTGH